VFDRGQSGKSSLVILRQRIDSKTRGMMPLFASTVCPHLEDTVRVPSVSAVELRRAERKAA